MSELYGDIDTIQRRVRRKSRHPIRHVLLNGAAFLVGAVLYIVWSGEVPVWLEVMSPGLLDSLPPSFS
jgi:hypothetical protein